MVTSSKPSKRQDDLARPLLAAGMVAALPAYIQVEPFVERYLDHRSFIWGLIMLALSAGLALMYLLGTAAARKHGRPGYLNGIPLVGGAAGLLYDTAVDSFALAPWLVLASVFFHAAGYLLGGLSLLVVWLAVRGSFAGLPRLWRLVELIKAPIYK